MMKKALCFILAIIFVLCLCSCGSKEAELVNLWVKSPGDTIEFFKDGTFILYEYYKEKGHGEFIVSDGTLKLSNAFDASTFKYSISNNTLSLQETGKAKTEKYYLYDNSHKKPKEELSVDKAKEIYPYKEDLCSIEYEKNYTDDEGYYHNAFKSVVYDSFGNKHTGESELLDFVYMSSAKEWVYYKSDAITTDSGERGYVIADSNLMGKWKYSDKDITIEISIDSSKDSLTKGNYYYKADDYMEKDNFSYTIEHDYNFTENKFTIFRAEDIYGDSLSAYFNEKGEFYTYVMGDYYQLQKS